MWSPFFDSISSKNANPADLRVDKQTDDDFLEGNRTSISFETELV